MVGCACAICGVLVIALPVSVVASNFSIFYTYVKARLNVPPKTKRITLSHALTSMHNNRSSSDHGAPSCSDDRRNTARSTAPSEASYTSVAPSPPATSHRLKPRGPYTSRSLTSITSATLDEGRRGNQGITVTLETPTHATSVIELPRCPEEAASSCGLLQVPFGRLRRHQDEDCPTNSFGSFGSFSPLADAGYNRLHLRRGAVSPASFSLKSTSTTSSFSHLPRGSRELCSALRNSHGPIIVLSNPSLQSLDQPHLHTPLQQPMFSQSVQNLSTSRDDSSTFSFAGHGFCVTPNSAGKQQTKKSHSSFDLSRDSNSMAAKNASDVEPSESKFLSVPVDFGPHRTRSGDKQKSLVSNECSDASTVTCGSSESDTCDQRGDNPVSVTQSHAVRSEHVENSEPQGDTLLKMNADQEVERAFLHSPDSERASLLSSDYKTHTQTGRDFEIWRPIPVYPHEGDDRVKAPLICIEIDEQREGGGPGIEPELFKDTRVDHDHSLQCNLDYLSEKTTQV